MFEAEADMVVTSKYSTSHHMAKNSAGKGSPTH